eukprot:1145373-Pelagomonas_calceolata.AAC.1
MKRKAYAGQRPRALMKAAGSKSGQCVGMLGSCSFQSNGGVGVWIEFQLNKVYPRCIPVLRRYFRSIKVSLSAWERAHKESIGAALTFLSKNRPVLYEILVTIPKSKDTTPYKSSSQNIFQQQASKISVNLDQQSARQVCCSKVSLEPMP